MKYTFFLLVSLFVVSFTPALAQSKAPITKNGYNKPNKKNKIPKEVNSKSIVEGKILSWTVSTDDEIAYTPPGKWKNVYGKTYYRYVERSGGKSIKVNQVAASAANILTPEQLEMITEIVKTQAKGEIKGIENRNAISRELIQWRKGENGDEGKILQLALENGNIISELIQQSASVYGSIMQSLSVEQRNTLTALRKTSDHASSNKNTLSSLGRSFTKQERTVFRILLSNFFIWSTSEEEMNRYIDSGRPAVFFGFANLRVEDRAGKKVSKGLRGEASRLVDQLLDNKQHEMLEGLISKQEPLLTAYYKDRADLASAIMIYQTDASQANTNTIHQLALQSEIGEAKLAIVQAQEMGKIIRSFTSAQMKTLTDFKNSNGE